MAPLLIHSIWSEGGITRCVHGETGGGRSVEAGMHVFVHSIHPWDGKETPRNSKRCVLVHPKMTDHVPVNGENAVL